VDSCCVDPGGVNSSKWDRGGHCRTSLSALSS
jgi:hypothetical protein